MAKPTLKLPVSRLCAVQAIKLTRDQLNLVHWNAGADCGRLSFDVSWSAGEFHLMMMDGSMALRGLCRRAVQHSELASVNICNNAAYLRICQLSGREGKFCATLFLGGVEPAVPFFAAGYKPRGSTGSGSGGTLPFG